MYPNPRRKNYNKLDPVMRWDLPDRIFFACGACHILAYAFLQRFSKLDAQAVWIKPKAGFRCSHVFVEYDGKIFDYHGVSERDVYLDHLFRRARHYFPGWDCDFIKLPSDVLISTEKSQTYDGMWLRAPDQFLHNALPRAYAYLDRLQT